MRRVISIVIMFLGVMIISAGILFQTSNATVKDEQNKIEEISYVPMNHFNQETLCTTYKGVLSFLNINDGHKVSFSYPDCIKEYELSFWNKILISDDANIKALLSKSNDNVSDYLEKKKTELKSNTNYQDISYGDIYTFTNDNGLKISFFQANYQENINDEKTDYDAWYITFAINENDSFTWEIISKNGVFSYEAIKEIVNSLDIENNAILVNTKKGEKYQTGYIRQNSNLSYDHGVKVNLSIPNKYPEIASYKTDFDESIFQYENGKEKVYVDLSIDNDNYHNINEKIDLSHKVLVEKYGDEELYSDIFDTGILEKVINDKQLFYCIYGYYDVKNDEKNYLAYGYYQIDNNVYYDIYINSTNVIIDEELISQFLDFSVEQY